MQTFKGSRSANGGYWAFSPDPAFSRGIEFRECPGWEGKRTDDFDRSRYLDADVQHGESFTNAPFIQSAREEPSTDVSVIDPIEYEELAVSE